MKNALQTRQLFPCELSSGRLLAECKEGMAGIKTLLFAKFNDVVPVIDPSGCITDIGTVEVYRFEMGTSLGEAIETLNSSEESGVAYLEQVITMALLSIKCEDLPDLNALKKGRWVIFALYYDNATRAFGLYNGASSSGGDSTSGVAPADSKVMNMAFTGRENDYAPFLEPVLVPDAIYNPFKDMAAVTVLPAYP